MNVLIDLSGFQGNGGWSQAESALDKCLVGADQKFKIHFLLNAEHDGGASLKAKAEARFQGKAVYFASKNSTPDSRAILLGGFLRSLKIGHVALPAESTSLPLELWQAACALAGSSLSDNSVATRPAPVAAAPPDGAELVIISPFPPDRSGVADYVVQILPYLQRYYKCLLLCDREPGQSIPTLCSTINASEFLARPELHKRVFYHLGNSPYHLQALALLQQVPGVVLLHDFFFNEMLQYEGIAKKSGPPFSAIADSHGASGLFAFLHQGDGIALPCSRAIFEQANAVLVHSDFARSLASKWYGAAACEKTVQIPFPKEIAERAPSEESAAARRRLGFAETDFIVSTFGFGTPSKDHESLIEGWSLSEPGSRSDACLVFVGEFGNPSYRARIEGFIAKCGVGRNIRFAGYADANVYKDYLRISDIAVQLRTESRGETSAATLDCLAHGVPTLSNAHGSTREISPQALWLLDEAPSSAQLAASLDRLWRDRELRQRFSDGALSYVRQRHDPEAAVSAYVAAIESAASSARFQHELDCIEQYTQARTGRSAEEDEAFCLNLLANRGRIGLPQILVDVSALIREDLRTGIQRVVRSLLLEMLSNPPQGFVVEPIYLDDSLRYRYARQFVLAHFGMQQSIEDRLVSASADDIYFGVDLHTHTTLRTRDLLVDWRRSGVRIVNVLYDLLPLQRPDCFPNYVHDEFAEWLTCILDCSDSVLAISQTVARDLAAMTNKAPPSADQSAPGIGWFHLGSDIEASAPTKGVTNDLARLLDQINGSKFFLMVSTLEPRKGHALVLAAFDSLWDQGFDGSLVIVGRQGWMVELLVERLRAHPQINRRLFWLDRVSDEALEMLYKSASALIAASEGEGFGLPIIEAARHDVPIIARDIPVFREIGGSGISYFEADNAKELAEFILAWLAIPHASRPDPACVKWLSWRQSVEQALDVLLERPGARWISARPAHDK